MKMLSLDQKGVVDSWLVAFIITFVIFLGSVGFGLSAYSGKQDYKNNVDSKISVAVKDAVAENSKQKDIEFTKLEKEPLKTYTGPSAFGSVSVTYPKTWSAYIDDSGKSSIPVDGYLNPNFVPGLQSGSGVALRFQVLNTPYAQVVRAFDGVVKTGKAKITPYVATKVPNITGIRIEGEYQATKSGSMIVLPLRDKTLQVWTEGNSYAADYNNIILPNITFIP